VGAIGAVAGSVVSTMLLTAVTALR
jgi:hypothetical protein